MKKILYFLIPALAAVLFYPKIGARYGDHWEVVQLLSVFLMNTYFWMEFGVRIGEFASCKYRFYKAAGAGSEKIAVRFLMDNLSFAFMWAGICFVAIYDGKPVENLIVWLQWMIFTAAAIIIVYEILHLRFRRLFAIGGLLAAGVVLVCLIVEIAGEDITGINDHSMTLICNVKIMQIVKNLFLEINLPFIILSFGILLMAYIALSFFDNGLINSVMSKKNAVGRGAGFARSSWNGNRILLEIKRILSLKVVCLTLTLEFVFATLGIIVSYKFGINIFYWLFFFTGISGLLGEYAYIIDIPAKLMYRLLGVEFDRLFKTKLLTVIIMNTPLILISFVAWILDGMGAGEFILLLINLFLANFEMVSFYSLKYLDLKSRMGVAYMLQTLFISIVALIPVVNLAFGCYLHKKAGSRWARHVGDSAG